MNRNIFKQLGVLLSFLLVFTQMSFAQPLATHAAALEQAVTITVLDNDGKGIIETEAVEFEEGDTAWDVLDEVAEDLDYEEYKWGKMLKGINGIAPDYDKDGTFWGFFVNGKSSDTGLDSYAVNNGDNILLAETDNLDAIGSVTVSAVDESGKEVVKEKEIEITHHSTAYDAIVQAIDNLEVTVDDQYFTMIKNINQYDIGDNDWWQILSDGKELNVGALSHQVQPGEHIQLKLQVFDGESNEDEDDESTEDETETEETVPKENDDKDNESTEVGNDDVSDKETEDKKTETPKNEDSEFKEISRLSKEDIEKLETDLNILTNKVLNNGLATEYGGEWWVWGLGVAGKKAPASYKKDVEEVIKENKGDLGPATELEKVIIALSNQGYDATNIAGYNLIELLENHEGLTQTVTSAIYALIAFNSGDYEVDADVEKKVLQYILDKELPNGGWNYFGNDISVDITGMALIALGYYQDNDNVKVKIDRAVKELSKVQHDNGGFYESFSGGYTSEAASQAIIGLISVGVDPTGELFTKKEGNLIEYLLKFRTAEGYLHTLKDEKPGPFPDQQALLALGFINQYLEKQSSDDGAGAPGKGSNDESDEDSNKGSNNDSTEEKSKVSIEQNKKVQVKAGQTIEVKGTKISIKMPKDLPQDAQIKVKVLDKVDVGSLEVAGDIVEVDVLDANGNPIKGDFVLTLAINKDLTDEDVSIYYFDEETNTWKHVGGTVNDDGTISATVPHFSKYGVFITAESDKEVVEEEEEEGESSSNTNGTKNEDEGKRDTDIDTKVEEDNNDETITEDKTSTELPDTATNMYNMIAIGLFIALIGATLLFIQRKRMKQS